MCSVRPSVHLAVATLASGSCWLEGRCSEHSWVVSVPVATAVWAWGAGLDPVCVYKKLPKGRSPQRGMGVSRAPPTGRVVRWEFWPSPSGCHSTSFYFAFPQRRVTSSLSARPRLPSAYLLRPRSDLLFIFKWGVWVSLRLERPLCVLGVRRIHSGHPEVKDIFVRRGNVRL